MAMSMDMQWTDLTKQINNEESQLSNTSDQLQTTRIIEVQSISPGEPPKYEQSQQTVGSTPPVFK